MTRDRAWLRRKYLSLGLGELASAVVFAVAAYAISAPSWPGSASLALWSALAPLVLILIQAGVYWLLARSWVGVRPMPRATARLYRSVGVGNIALLAAAAAAVVVWWPDAVHHAVLVVLVWLFGVAEYVNYFYVRLAYPLTRWFTTVGQWRTPQLVKDMRGSR